MYEFFIKFTSVSLSLELFNCVQEVVFKYLAVFWESKGILVGGERLTSFRFSDDIVLLSSSAPQLEKMLQLGRASPQVGLMINILKTQIMTNAEKSEYDRLQGDYSPHCVN